MNEKIKAGVALIQMIVKMLEEEAAIYIQNPGAHSHLLELAQRVRAFSSVPALVKEGVVERVARAMCAADDGVPDELQTLIEGTEPQPHWTAYEDLARAAIAALPAPVSVPDPVRTELATQMKEILKSARDQGAPEEDTRIQMFFTLPILEKIIGYLEEPNG